MGNKEVMMKLYTVKGEWIIIDGNNTFTVADSAVAFGYVLTMAQIRPIKCTTPSVYPVRSLVPHPKNRSLTKRQREFIKAYKSQYINYQI